MSPAQGVFVGASAGSQSLLAANRQVVFREMADEHPDADAGDVVFVLKQQDPGLGCPGKEVRM